MSNNFGKTSKLMIKASVKNEQTVLEDVFFSAPFKVMKPFYENDDCMTIMCLTASAGVMSGDEQDFNIYVGDGAKLEFVSQSYEKIHKMEEGFATRLANLHIGKDAYLYYNPLPTLPFKDSAFKSQLNVHLDDSSSQFILKEVLSAGRCSRGELFEYHYYHNHIQIFENKQLIYVDNTRFEPQNMDLKGIGMYENYTHLGNLILCHISKDDDWFKKVRTFIDETPDIQGGITLSSNNTIVIRVLGYQADQIDNLFNQLLLIE